MVTLRTLALGALLISGGMVVASEKKKSVWFRLSDGISALCTGAATGFMGYMAAGNHDDYKEGLQCQFKTDRVRPSMFAPEFSALTSLRHTRNLFTAAVIGLGATTLRNIYNATEGYNLPLIWRAKRLAHSWKASTIEAIEQEDQKKS